MGLFDKLKKKLGDARDQLAPQAPAPPPAYHAAEPDDDGDRDDDAAGDAEPAFDLAGFDPSDEEAFFHAVLHMESEGQFGGTDQSRAEIAARYGIRDHSHWLTVKESMYAMLARKHGSYEEVSQREMNWRSGAMQRHMQAQIANTAASGGFAPVEGVSLEQWAAMNAAIAAGAPGEDVLRGAGIEQARWDRVSGEWNARMARDTTFAIAQVYGNAFQAASQGRFGAHAREAAAARAANRELALEPPMTFEQYFEVLYEQAYAAKRGEDPVAALRACGLSVVDWTDVSTYMGYLFHRTAVRHWQEFEAMHKQVEARMAAKYPGVTPDVDLKF